MGKITSLAGLSTVLYQFPEGESMADVAARAEKVVAHLAAAPAEVDSQASESPSNPDPIVGAPGSGLTSWNKVVPTDNPLFRHEPGFWLVEVDEMTLEGRRRVPQTQAAISVPVEHFGSHRISWEPVVHTSFLQEQGWHIIRGLGDCKYLPGAILNNSITVLYEGKYLLPPTGVWPFDLPAKVASGEVIPDESWTDVFNRRPDLLAFAETEKDYKLEQWIDDKIRDHTASFWLRRGDEQVHWYVHRSKQGVEAFFRRLVGDGFSWEIRRRPNREKGQPDHLKLIVHGFTEEMKAWIPQLFGRGQWLKVVILAAVFEIDPIHSQQLHDGEMHLVP